MLNDSLVDILFQLNSHQIFWIGLLEIAHVRTAVVETHIVKDGVKIHVILISITGNFSAIDCPI